MRNELKKLNTKQLIELVKTFEHYPSVTLKDGKDYILSYLEDEACTISKKEIAEYLLNNNVEITKDNIHLYYEFMSDGDKNIHKNTIHSLLHNRAFNILRNLYIIDDTSKSMDKDFKSFKYISLVYFNNSTIRLESSIFGIMDTLKPIDEYIAEIKESEAYKIFTSECRCNNCMTYFESDDDLIDGEDEDGAFKGCPKCNTDKYLMNLANLK